MPRITVNTSAKNKSQKTVQANQESREKIMPAESANYSLDSVSSAMPENKIAPTKAKILDYLINSSLFLIFLICPIFFTGLTAQGIGFDKLMVFYFLVLIGTVAWIGKGVINGSMGIRKTIFDIPVLFFLLITFVSALFSINRIDSFLGTYGNAGRGFIAILIYIIFYYLLVSNINPRKAKIYFWTFLFSGLVAVIFSIFQFLGIFILPLSFTQAKLFNLIGSAQSLTIYLSVILPLIIVAISQTKEIHNSINKYLSFFIKIFFTLILLADIIILAFLNKLVFWPIVISGIFVLLVFFLSKLIKITSNNLIMPVTIFFLLIIFIVTGKFNTLKDLNISPDLSMPKATSFNIAKNSIAFNKFLGAGPSNYYYSFSKFKPLEYNETALWNLRFDGAPGLALESVPAIGLAGGLLAIIIILMALTVPAINFFKEKDFSVKPLTLAFIASAVSIIAFSQWVYFDNTLILIFVLILALAVATSFASRQESVKKISIVIEGSDKPSVILPVLFLCISGTVIVLCTIGVKIFLADYYAQQSLKAVTISNKIEKLNKVIELVDYRDIYYVGLSSAYLALSKEDISKGGDALIIADNLSKAMSYAKGAVSVNPNKSSNYENLASVCEGTISFTSNGLTELGKTLEETYYKIAELDPNNPLPYYRLALYNNAKSAIETNQEQKIKLISEAIKNYELAISKKKNLSEAYYGKGIAYEKLQNYNEAIDQLKNAIANSSQNVDYYFELGRLYFNRGMLNAQDISENLPQINEENNENPDEQPESAKTITKKGRNEDINASEQIFIEIIKAYSNHANAQYNLALLYKTIGENDKARIIVNNLLNILQTDQEKEIIRKQFEGLY